MKLLISGGGTGGHVSPGLGVAQELLRQNPAAKVVWAGTAAGIEEDMVGHAGLPFAVLDSAALKRSLAPGNLLLPFRLLRGFVAARGLLKKERPDAVLVTGGYVGVPVGLAAWMMGVPLVVHESNSVPGLANRLLGRLADEVCVGLPQAAGVSGDFPRFHRPVTLTGNPVRVGKRLPRRSAACKAFGLSPRKKTLFIFPGSRAAHRVNQAVGGALKLLEKHRGRLQVLWMCGLHDYTQAVRTARYFKIRVRVCSFIHDIAPAYACADLVLARAGASTLAEITALGLPAILVPYPHATADHQAANAGVLEQAGAADVIADSSLTPERLGALVLERLANPAGMKRMAANSRKLGKPHAAAEVLQAIRRAVKSGRKK